MTVRHSKPSLIFSLDRLFTRDVLSQETKLTYVTLLADPSIHPKYEAALKQIETEFGKHHPMYINGRKVLASEGEFDVRSPLDTKILLGYFQKGSAKLARKAIEAGKDAFEEWSKKSWKERVAIIRRAPHLSRGSNSTRRLSAQEYHLGH